MRGIVSVNSTDSIHAPEEDAGIPGERIMYKNLWQESPCGFPHNRVAALMGSLGQRTTLGPGGGFASWCRRIRFIFERDPGNLTDLANLTVMSGGLKPDTYFTSIHHAQV